jgi:aquaporin NIP
VSEVPLGRRAVAEFIGTALLVAIGPGAAAVDVVYPGVVTHVGVAIAFALIVMAAIAAFGDISGAHINPAVTIALWSDRRFPRHEVPTYLLAQCAGAVAGGVAIAALLGGAVRASATIPAVNLTAALAVELGLSSLLMVAILGVIHAPAMKATGAIVIGLTVGVCALVGGPLTGASMNPARSLGPAVASGVWTAHWVYWLAPIGGMLATVRSYNWLRAPSA